MKKLIVKLRNEDDEKAILALLDSLDYEYEIINIANDQTSAESYLDEDEKPILQHYATE